MIRDDETPSLDLEPADGFEQLLGAAVHYRSRSRSTTTGRWAPSSATSATTAPTSRYDDLVDGRQEPIDVSGVDMSMDGIELADREFFAAIREGREPNASAAQCLGARRTLDRLEKSLTLVS